MTSSSIYLPYQESEAPFSEIANLDDVLSPCPYLKVLSDSCGMHTRCLSVSLRSASGSLDKKYLVRVINE
jgi:hypothetical protein